MRRHGREKKPVLCSQNKGELLRNHTYRACVGQAISAVENYERIEQSIISVDCLSDVRPPAALGVSNGPEHKILGARGRVQEAVLEQISRRKTSFKGNELMKWKIGLRSNMYGTKCCLGAEFSPENKPQKQ